MRVPSSIVRSVSIACLLGTLFTSAARAQTPVDPSGQTELPDQGLALLMPSPPAVEVAPLPQPSPSPLLLPQPSSSPAAIVPAAPAAVQPQTRSMIRWGYMVGDTLPDSVRQHPEDFDVLSPAWFHFDADGDIYGQASPEVEQFARAHNIKLVPIVDNGEFDPDVAHGMLIDGSLQTHALDSLQSLLSDGTFAGINIDFENIYDDDRVPFDAFMSNVYARLHPLGKLVTIALPAKTNEDPGFGYPFDYAGLAPNFDLAVIMTYDDHYAGGQAGAVAPLDWVGDVINYATKFIPANKLLLGLPFYGYDWDVTDGGWASAIGYSDIQQTVFDHGGSVYMDPQSHTPVYTYTDPYGSTHQIWFEDSTSLSYKLTLAENKGLAGWGAWRVGLEDQNFYSLNLTGRSTSA